MIIIKLIALVAFFELSVGLFTDEEIKQRAHDYHDGFIEKNFVKPTADYRYGSEILDPDTDITTTNYEIRYNDLSHGLFSTLENKGGHRRTVAFTLDATNGYRATLTNDPPDHTTLDIAHLTSPLVTATPPHTDKKETFTNFLITDKENVDKHSPDAAAAYRTYFVVKDYFDILRTPEYTWGYQIEGLTSQYEKHSGDFGEGRVTNVNADGCVSTMDYTLDSKNFNVSTVRHFGKQDIPQLYLEPKHYPLLLQIARAPSKCDV